MAYLIISNSLSTKFNIDKIKSLNCLYGFNCVIENLADFVEVELDFMVSYRGLF